MSEYERLIAGLGEPSRDDPRVHRLRGARKSRSQRPPIVIPHAELAWRCGCEATLGSGGSYRFLRVCGAAHEISERDEIDRCGGG